MSFLKNLLLSILGFFRVKSNQAVDLRYAGNEHIHQVKNKIEDIRSQRNQLAGQGILLESKITIAKENVSKFTDAVKHHAAEGNEELKQKAYRAYMAEQTILDQLIENELDLRNQVADLDTSIARLEQDTNDAKNQLGKAASKQLVGKANGKVEDVHQSLSKGPLADVIEQSETDSAVAEARRRERKANDNSDVLAYQKKGAVLSMDELLGNEVEGK
jgi:phage shock protein A